MGDRAGRRGILDRLRARRAGPRLDEADGGDGFDPVFYARRYGDLAGLDAAMLRAHFSVYGRREGRAGNPDALIAALEARHGPRDPGFDPEAYRTANPDIRPGEPWELAAHYLERGRDEGRDAPRAAALQPAHHARNAARLSAVHARRPADADLRHRLVRTLFLAGQAREARALLARAPAGDPEMPQLLAFGRFVETTPLDRALALLAEVRGRHGLGDTAAVADAILAARAERRPFALVRLGDGEGAFATVGPEDEAAHAALYARNRGEWARYWFGPDLDPVASGFTPLALGLPAIMAEADVLGIPYPGWIENEYAVGHPRGIAGLANLVRWLHANEAALAGRALASQLVHLDLAAVGFFPRLFAGQREVGLVSCFPELPERLGARFGVAVEFHKLPGEQHFKDLIGEAAAGGWHYPDVYRATTARLSRPLHGKVFLVAGGILGKFYAATIRRHGGIAIDIGSLADAWAGKATRTGYESLPGFGLG